MLDQLGTRTPLEHKTGKSATKEARPSFVNLCGWGSCTWLHAVAILEDI